MKISPSKYLILFSLAFFVGIFFAELLDYNWQTLFVSILPLIAIIFIFGTNPKIRFIPVIGICFLIGIFYYHYYSQIKKDQLFNFYQKEVVLQGQVIADPDIRSDNTKLTIQVYQIKLKDQKDFQSIQGKVLVSQERYPEYQFADWLEVSGKINQPKKYPDFDYQSYLARFGIYSVMSYCQISEIEQPPQVQQNILTRSWIKIKKSLYWVKNQFAEKIGLILPEPQSSFLAGLLLGAKRSIPKNLFDAFAATGTTHIVVISGYNITIIIATFMKLTRRWSKKLAIILAVLGVFLFTIMVGAEAPVLRAALMALLIVWAERIGRKSDATIALIITALIMVFLNPKTLRFDIGFQLSFLAVAGLIWFSPIVESWLSSFRWRKFIPQIISEPLIATLSAQIFTIPIILYNFHRLSIIAPIANVLILPAIPLTMFGGFVATILSFVWLKIGQVTAFVAWLFLSYMILIVNWLSKLPVASVENFQIGWIWLIVWYSMLLIFTFWYHIKYLSPTQSPSGKRKNA